ncbi:MAG TPA: hypothetical protein VKS78_14635 [Roseiarcus sp.]|nr:hypothetical protein [Roseiarcus sp.]
MPLFTAVASSQTVLIPLVAGLSLAFLAALGAFAGRVGGASVGKGAVRVLFWALRRWR